MVAVVDYCVPTGQECMMALAIVLCVWGLIAMCVLYSIGSAFGGRKAGFEAIGIVIGAILLYGGGGWFLYFSIVTIAKAIAT